MQAVYDILTRIKFQLKQDKNVNTVSTGDIFDVDLKKQSIYPLSHIILNNATLEGARLNVWNFSVSVMCMDVVDISKEAPIDLFVGNDNEQDVLNTQHAVLARLFKVLANEDNLFSLSGEPTVEPFYDRFQNKLAGWTSTMEIKVVNTIDSCDIVPMPEVVCADGTAVNSDNTYSLVVPSGGVKAIPDTEVTVRDQNDNVLGVTNLPSAVSGDAIVSITDGQVVNSDSSYSLSVPVGSTTPLPDTAVTNTDGSFSQDYPSVSDIVLADIEMVINVNGNFYQSITYPALSELIVNLPTI